MKALGYHGEKDIRYEEFPIRSSWARTVPS